LEVEGTLGDREGAAPNQTAAEGSASRSGLFQLFETAFHFFDRVLNKLHGDPRLTILWGFAVLLFVSLVAILFLNRHLAPQWQWLQEVQIALVILALVFLFVFTVARMPAPPRERPDSALWQPTAATPADRKAYETWHGWAELTIGGDERTINIATLVALETLRRGGDSTAAMDAARASVGVGPTKSPLVADVVDAARSGLPAPQLVRKRGRAWMALGGCAATLFLLTVVLIFVLAAIGAALTPAGSPSAGSLESGRAASLVMQGICVRNPQCPVTPALAERLETLAQQGIDGRCHCQMVAYSYLVTGATQTTSGGIAHVLVTFGNGVTTGIDVVVVQGPVGWLATDFRCAGSSTSIFNDPVASCPAR
jgi:hypothetical protein